PQTRAVCTRDMESVDNEGWVTHLCVYWSVYDWQAPVYSPMEDPRFPADSEFTSERYAASWDKGPSSYAKSQMLAQLPLPHHWRSRIWAPRGAPVLQQFHIGHLYPPEETFANWMGAERQSRPRGRGGGGYCVAGGRWASGRTGRATRRRWRPRWVPAHRRGGRRRWSCPGSWTAPPTTCSTTTSSSSPAVAPRAPPRSSPSRSAPARCATTTPGPGT